MCSAVWHPYHKWDKRRHQKRQVQKADRKKSDIFFNFRGKICHFVFFRFFLGFSQKNWNDTAFFTVDRFFYWFAFFTGCPLFLRTQTYIAVSSQSNFEIFFCIPRSTNRNGAFPPHFLSLDFPYQHSEISLLIFIMPCQYF